jgi:hypothetical protein
MGLLSTKGEQAVKTKGGSYLAPNKLKSGEEVRFAIIDTKTQYLEYWECWGQDPKTEAKQPFRFVDCPTPTEIEQEMEAAGCERMPGFDGKTVDAPRFTIALPAFNYEESKVQVLTISQKRLVDDLHKLSLKEEYADLTEIDLILEKQGEKLTTVYTITPVTRKAANSKRVSDAWEEYSAEFDIRRMLTGGDPFSAEESDKVEEKGKK